MMHYKIKQQNKSNQCNNQILLIYIYNKLKHEDYAA